MKYAIYNDSNHVVSPSDIEFADTINPADISMWNGNLSAFRDRGGKLLTYHCRSDVVS
jgi:feruloyl esterase